MAVSVDSLSSLFPLTQPVPNVVSHPGLLPMNELALELDLIRSGSSNFTRWVHHIANVTATVNAAEKSERGSASESEVALLGAKLSTKAGRHGLQRLTDLYERALAQFPQSYKLWKQYLDMRCSYVLGSSKRKVNFRAPKKKRAGNADGEEDNGGTSLFLKYLNEGVKDAETGELGEELSDSERDVDAIWSGGLDGVIGAEEWRSLAGTFERAIMWQPRVRLDCDVPLYYADARPRRCRVSGSSISTSSCIHHALLSYSTRILGGPSTGLCESYQNLSMSVYGGSTSNTHKISLFRRYLAISSGDS